MDFLGSAQTYYRAATQMYRRDCCGANERWTREGKFAALGFPAAQLRPT